MNKWNRIEHQPNLPLGKNGTRVTASPEHIRLSLQAAKEGMVLLKNDNKALPLQKGTKVALFGKGTYDYVKGGGGSGDVTVPYVHNLADGLKNFPEYVTVFEGTDGFYAQYVRNAYEDGRAPGLMQEPDLPDDLVAHAAAFADTAIVSISRFSSEGWDRKSAQDPIKDHVGVWKNDPRFQLSETLYPDGDYVLTQKEVEMLEKVKKAFDKVIVVLNVGSVFDTSFFKDDPAIDAALIGWQAGLEGGFAEAELLLGLDTPSGKLADTFAASLEDYPSTEGFYTSDSYVSYEEDIYVGYRYFETVPGAAQKVNYPFGYGLSYTSFALSEPQVQKEGEEIVIHLAVTNTGDYPGKEVIQVYYGAPQGKLGKPSRQLVAWKKTRRLEAGETQQMILRFPIRDMASYDDLGKVQKSAWVLEKGDYLFFVGTSVRAPQSDFVLTLDEDQIIEQLSPRMVPTQLERRMLADGSFEALPLGTPNDPDANALEPLPESAANGMPPAVRGIPSSREKKPDFMAVVRNEMDLDAFVSALSDEDLAWMLGGQPNTGVANTYGYGNLPQYGVPNVMSADGPAGLRIRPGLDVVTTAFPCACLLACTWNEEVTRAVGRAAGEEVKENNIGVWLAPAVNIHRNPLCGRNFEYYSEDPLLTGHLAGNLIAGVQSNGIAAMVKHLALNNKETNRRQADSRASERAIREIYLKAFEICCRTYDVWSVMTSYNIINGHRASECNDLLNGILREEWGYEGMVSTDWWTAGEHYKECAAGNDVKMACGFPDRLLEAMEKGALNRRELERAAKHVLGLILKLD